MERQDSGLASIKSVVALRDFDAAFDRFGSPPEVAVWALMSALASSGHWREQLRLRRGPFADQAADSDAKTNAELLIAALAATHLRRR
jgi:hypothetical protein